MLWAESIKGKVNAAGG